MGSLVMLLSGGGHMNPKQPEIETGLLSKYPPPSKAGKMEGGAGPTHLRDSEGEPPLQFAQNYFHLEHDAGDA